MILVLLIFLSNVLPCGHAHGILQKSTGKLTVNVKAKISFFWKYLEYQQRSQSSIQSILNKYPNRQQKRKFFVS